MKRGLIAAVCAVLAAGVGAQTKIADCTRQNVTYVGLLDGKTPVVAYYMDKQGLVSVERKYYVDVGERQEGPYDLQPHRLTFSPDGKAFAYSVIIDHKDYVITNGEKSVPCDYAGLLTFSPDGKTLVYVAKIDDKYYVVADGKKSGPYDKVDCLIFSPDGKTLAYTVKIDNKFYVITNGEKSEPYGYACSLTFLPDGKTLAYGAEIGTARKSKWYVIVGEKKEALYDYGSALLDGDLAFSPDGKTFAYTAKIDGKHGGCYVVVGEEKAGPYYGSVGEMTFSPDGKMLAYRVAVGAMLDWKSYIVVGVKTAGPYDGFVNCLTFSPDSKTFAYEASVDGKHHYIIADGKTVGPYNKAEDIMFSPDSKALAYTATVDGYIGVNCIIIDDTTYIGSICGGHAVYLDFGAIWTR